MFVITQGDSDSDLDNNHERSEAESRRKKLSREERKLEAYVKQIEKMEKKEKKRQQPQKEHRPILRVSSDEGKTPHNRGLRGQKRPSHKRRSNGSSSGLKKKRARASSFSSEPLSPDEVSSSASTPTTPKTVTTIAEEPLVETPSTSPSRNFRFPKTKADENSQDGYFKTEAVSSSVLSSPISPCSPRESETETKQTLSTASSNSDIAMEIEMEESEAGRLDDSCEVLVTLNGTASGDLGSALSVRLAEISNMAGSESNTPSPCPSTSGTYIFHLFVAIYNITNGLSQIDQRPKLWDKYMSFQLLEDERSFLLSSKWNYLDVTYEPVYSKNNSNFFSVPIIFSPISHLLLNILLFLIKRKVRNSG